MADLLLFAANGTTRIFYGSIELLFFRGMQKIIVYALSQCLLYITEGIRLTNDNKVYIQITQTGLFDKGKTIQFGKLIIQNNDVRT